jgi:hypothetical protein
MKINRVGVSYTVPITKVNPSGNDSYPEVNG